MEHHAPPLIAMIVLGIGLAFVFGTIANRLRVSPLVGYLLAGVVVGPFTPGYVADQNLALQLAGISVILLMFGVGLHFSLADLPPSALSPFPAHGPHARPVAGPLGAPRSAGRERDLILAHAILSILINRMVFAGQEAFTSAIPTIVRALALARHAPPRAGSRSSGRRTCATPESRPTHGNQPCGSRTSPIARTGGSGSAPRPNARGPDRC